MDTMGALDAARTAAASPAPGPFASSRALLAFVELHIEQVR